MKGQSVFLLFLLLANASFGQAISDLNSDSAVKNFVIRTNYSAKDFAWAYFDLTTGREVSDYFSDREERFRIDTVISGAKWAKVDLNKDAIEDLIISGVTNKPEQRVYETNYRLLVYLSKGDGSYKQIDLTPRFLEQFPIYFNLINLQGQNSIELVRVVNNDDWVSCQIIRDTLVYKFDHFLEYNSNVHASAFKKLTYYTTSNWVTYQPDFFEVDDRRNVYYKKGAWPDSASRESHFKMSRSDFLYLKNLLGYVDPAKLRNKYSKPVFDVGNSNLIIKYTDNQEKHIDDYGHWGTYGLRAIYEWIYAYRNQHMSR